MDAAFDKLRWLMLVVLKQGLEKKRAPHFCERKIY